MGKSIISMVIFNSYVKLPEGMSIYLKYGDTLGLNVHQPPSYNHYWEKISRLRCHQAMAGYREIPELTGIHIDSIL